MAGMNGLALLDVELLLQVPGPRGQLPLQVPELPVVLARMFLAFRRQHGASAGMDLVKPLGQIVAW